MPITAIKFTLIDAAGEESEKSLPAKFEICPTCQGKGTRVNPSIDGHGLSREDFDADPQFEEDYFAGVYDIECDHCHGEKVVAVIDTQAVRRMKGGRALLKAYYDHLDARTRDYGEERFLRQMEAGERY